MEYGGAPQSTTPESILSDWYLLLLLLSFGYTSLCSCRFWILKEEADPKRVLMSETFYIQATGVTKKLDLLCAIA
jgi:hypothetical protein